jgi:phospholipid N-methyltransferase
MNENIQFLQAFLKSPLRVGSIKPSSPELAMKMIDGFQPDAGNIIVELGVGTGAVTRFIEHILPDPESYLGIELDRNLVDLLAHRFPKLKIENGSAGDLRAIHRGSGLGRIRYIACCLPFVSLPGPVVDQVLAEVEALMNDGCTFRTFQYAHGFYMPAALRLREFMRSRYGRARKSPLVVKNVPPAFTLTWSTL